VLVLCMRLCHKSNIAVELLKPAGPSGDGHGAGWAPGLNWDGLLQTAGWGRVQMPYALSRRYPNAEREWGW
jgi:hypothetical protein